VTKDRLQFLALQRLTEIAAGKSQMLDLLLVSLITVEKTLQKPSFVACHCERMMAISQSQLAYSQGLPAKCLSEIIPVTFMNQVTTSS
jgi:hypothetical protein